MTSVHRIAVGRTEATSAEGGNSAYVLPEHGVVIDPGPPSERAWDQLVEGFDDADLSFDDVETILVTHWHADHSGLAPRLATEAGATLHMHALDAPLVAEYAAARRRRIQRDRDQLVAWGVPSSLASAVTDEEEASALPDRYEVRQLADGDRIAGLTVRHTPGHTLGHVAFLLDERAFVGDAVLRTVTPNVGGGDTRLVRALREYEATLDTLDDEVETAYPGHGGPFALRERIREIRAHHDERAARVYDLLTADNERTPWDLARDLFGRMEGVHVKFGAGEAASHLARLVEQDRVARTQGDVTRFALLAD